MHWRTKLLIQRATAALPRRLGNPLYHVLQQAGGLVPNCSSHWNFVTRCDALLCQLSGSGLAGKTVVELGSGWYPLTPLIVICFGARELFSFDLDQHYSRARIAAAARALMRFDAQFARSPMLLDVASTGRLPAAVKHYPRTDIVVQNALAGRSVDLAISRAVLEHVEPATIVKIHAASRRWLAPHGHWIHLISPSDHRAYSDPSLHLVDFLRYSDSEWRTLAGNRFAYHNRLRRPQFAELFEAAGWKIAKQEFSVPPSVLSSLAGLPIHADFEKLAPEDLVASSLWFVLRAHPEA
jgi:hypothetical protein